MEDVDLEPFGLTPPLTADDLVYNWEAIFELRHEVSLTTLADQAHEIYGNEYGRSWWVRRWLFPEG